MITTRAKSTGLASVVAEERQVNLPEEVDNSLKVDEMSGTARPTGDAWVENPSYGRCMVLESRGVGGGFNVGLHSWWVFVRMGRIGGGWIW